MSFCTNEVKALGTTSETSSTANFLFSYNTVIDSIFYGIGKTKYLAYQAILTNGTVYLAAFLLYVCGAWSPTFEGVMVLYIYAGSEARLFSSV